MQVTGYKILHVLRELQHSRDIASSQFSSGLYAFKEDEGIDIKAAFERFTRCETSIARLQVMQAQYNLGVTVSVMGEEMTLHEAIKRVGGVGRMEKMWRSASKDKSSTHSYYGRELTRNTSEEIAQRTVPIEECANYARVAAKHASAMREAIQIANATPYEVDDKFESLFTE